MPYPLEKFRGIFPAALTTFDKDNNLDENATAAHWEWLIRQGVDGLVIAGTSGEFIALENDERVRLFRLARDVVKGRVPLIYGSGHYSTRLTVELSLQAAALGADALIVILPYYQKPSKAAVIEHFRHVRKAADLPVMLYNNPANSACVDLNPREIAQLVDEDVLHMVKSTYETVVPVHDLSFLLGDRMAIFYGSFQAAYEAFCAGAHGWVSGVLNVVPKAAKAMYEACLHNDARRGFAIWKKILPIVHLYTWQQVGPVSDLATYRSILNFWGLHGGYSRNPFFPLDEQQEAVLRKLLEASGWMDPDSILSDVE
ncbi:MAG: dihydrodipicolinate synthase family protein [Bryobacteraceae bacterium]